MTCRRCIECEPGEEHHWLDNSIDPDDEGSVADFREEHPGVEVSDELLLAHQECKHCPAVRPYPDDEDES